MALKHLNTSEFDQAVNAGDDLCVVDMFATWCGPCKMLAPVIENLADRYAGKVSVCKVDIDAQAGLASRFSIMSIPTVLIFQDGELQQKAVGVQPETVYTQMLDSALEG